MHAIYRIVDFEIVGAYTLKVRFDDGREQVVDFRPILAGEVYGPLRDRVLFEQVEIDPEVHTLVWPNGADIDPMVLHDWDMYKDEMERMARKWAEAVVVMA
jgi:hypothetical protein